MSEIVKTEAVVLSKINYGDTSSIVSLYTEKEGKIHIAFPGGVSSVTPGQSAVFYEGDDLVGGGIIC